MSKPITLLGSTGSIGVNALDLVSRYHDQYHVVALSARRNVEVLAAQIRQFKPLRAWIESDADLQRLQSLLPSTCPTQLLCGASNLNALAASPEAELVINALVGFAGVAPTLAAIEAKKNIALANKETLVAAGPLVRRALQQQQVQLLPVDSEHSAIFQALQNNPEPKDLRRVILTASGGPFLHSSSAQMAEVTVEQALKHPTWNMGAKISIDSATMMNKGLEVIEATRLFDLSSAQVDVIIHPESIIHSFVEFVDGSQLAQLGVADMRGPLAYAMAYPRRLAKATETLQLSKIGKLNFFDPDFARFPCLRLAYEAAKIGESMPAVLNAANEVAVDLFLNRRIRFMQIPSIVEKVMAQHSVVAIEHLPQLCDIDGWARNQVQVELTREK